MSWWNTSNFTDLASKALKNAQEKIDKALDISEDGKRKAAAAADVPTTSKKESKVKSDAWSGWLGEGPSTDGPPEDQSSWSFPWGAGAEGGQEKDTAILVKEKTAEEIKSEVLKAAKERTKAKSKLFPQKAKQEKFVQENIKEKDDLSKENTPEPLISDSLNTKESLALHKDDTKSIFPSSKDSEHKEPVDPAKTGINIKHVTDESLISKCESKADTTPDVNESVQEEPEGYKAEHPEVSVSEQSTDLNTEEIFSELSVDPKYSEAGISAHTSSSSFQELSVNESKLPDMTVQVNELKVEVEEHASQVRTKSEDESNTSFGSGLLKLSEMVSDSVSQKNETIDNNSEQSLDDMSKSFDGCTDLPQDKSKVESVVLHSTEDLNRGMLSVEDSGATDISSSVEFVTDSDIPNLSDNLYTEEYIYAQSSSDPEMIDCDKTSTNSSTKQDNVEDGSSSQEEFQTVIIKYDGALEERLQDEVKDTGVTRESLSISDTLCDDSISVVQSEVTCTEPEKFLPGSDSESSVGKLDISMDTSEETVVEQVLNEDESEKSSNWVNNETVNIKVELETDLKDQHTEMAETESSSIVDEFVVQDVAKFKDDLDDDDKNDDKLELSPSHSFVKCMLEDVTDDGKQDDNSDSHSATEKSEGSRSIYSNQESSDEIDTTTSSDIEIISLPTPNGENRQVSPIDPMPLRIALQKTKNWRHSPTHRRTDSSDSSNASKDGGYGELSPVRDNLDYPEYHRSQHEQMEGHKLSPELPALSEEDDNPYHPQRLLKDETKMEESHDMRSHDQLSHDLQTDIDKKLAEKSEVLQAREDKLLQLSKDNCDLMETNSILNNQLKQSEEAREAEMADVNELTSEFTHRLTEAEKRVSTAIREKETLKQQLQDVQAELAKRAGDASLKQIVADQEEQISGLLQEGEKLSKSQLQSNTIIKKLRQKEKDNESTLTTQKKKLETQKEELDHLHKVLESKEELEKKQAESIAQLTSAVNKQDQDSVRLKSEHEDAVEKVRGLQVALDNSYKEIAELHRNNAAHDSKASEAALSAEMQVREELKMTIEKQHQQHRWDKDSLSMQIEDLRLSMTRTEKDHSRREDLLRQEISHLQKQLQEDEARTQELTQGVSLATRPLLRQIENLQSTYKAHSNTWEKVEKNLSDRLGDTQNQLAVSMDKERTANEQVLDLGSKVTTLETQTSRLRQEKSQLTAQLEMLKSKVEMSEDAKHSEAAHIEVLKQQMTQETTELVKQKVLLETQLDVEKSKAEQEKKKVNMLQEQMRDMERDLQRSRSHDTPVRATPSPIHVSISRNDSMVDSFSEHSFKAITQDELDRSFVLSSPNGNKQSLYEALRQSGAANLLENLQSQLKLRDGEINHLQSEIRSLERTRESMARELVDLSNRNDDLEGKLEDLPILQEKCQELDQRYNALLQMYGEKVEETAELKLDLQDVKDMYKAQINHLLGQS